MLVISNDKYTLYKENRIEVYHYVIANRINRLLGYYDYRFKAGDEAIFRFSDTEREKVLKLL